MGAIIFEVGHSLWLLKQYVRISVALLQALLQAASFYVPGELPTLWRAIWQTTGEPCCDDRNC